MSVQQVLTPEDDLFGRVLIVNHLATLGQIVECARVISAEVVAGRPRRPLAKVMVSKGYLTPEKTGAVEAALRKRASAAQGQAAPASAAPKPKPKPMKKRAPAGDSQVMVPVDPKAGSKGERVWVSVSTRQKSATVQAECSSLYPEDVPALAAACRCMFESGQPKLFINLHRVRHLPSIVVAELAKANIQAREANRHLVLFVNGKTAHIVKMIVGNSMDMRIA